MIQRFAPLFTVAVRHSYYAGNCEDFEFVAPSSTARAMRGGKVLTRVLSGRLHAMYELESPGVPIHSLAGRTLLFGLRLTNSSFGNYTDAVLNDVRQAPFYGNDENPAELQLPRGIVLASGWYSHAPQVATRPLTLRLSNHQGVALASHVLPPNAADGSFDLRALSEGVYEIDEISEGETIAQTRLVLNAELHNAGVWGLLAIEIDAGFYAAPPEFTLEFEARKEQLSYFVVARNYSQPEFDQLDVTDLGHNGEGNTPLLFDRVPSDALSATDIARDFIDDGQSQFALFQSREAVARNQRGFRNIQLSRNGDVLVANLPLPSADRPEALFIIRLTKP